MNVSKDLLSKYADLIVRTGANVQPGQTVLLFIAVEQAPFSTCIFETASAIGTVGLSLGVTPSLGVVSQVILMVLMFLGRVGGLTVIYAAISGSPKKLSKLPQGKITVG